MQICVVYFHESVVIVLEGINILVDANSVWPAVDLVGQVLESHNHGNFALLEVQKSVYAGSAVDNERVVCGNVHHQHGDVDAVEDVK